MSEHIGGYEGPKVERGDLKPPPASAIHNKPTTVTAKHHAGSDRYYVVSTEDDKDGVPLVEIQINRATHDGVDVRHGMALHLYRLLRDNPYEPSDSELQVHRDADNSKKEEKREPLQ